MAASSIVIKVKYGETLRRFNASIDDKKLALDIVTLKEKIRSLFSFGSDVEFTLIYVDEDGDSVTLADDDDLHDVVRQSLNPLRIAVNLNNGNPNGSSGTSTPLRSPQQQIPIQSLNSGVAEFLKAVPEPLREAIAKFQQEVTSKASSSAPAVAEFLKNVPEPLREAIAKFQQELTSKASSSAPTAAAHLVERMKSFHLNQISASNASPIVNPPTNGAPMVNAESSTVKDSNVNKEAWSSNIKKKEKPVKKATEVPRSVDLNIPYFGYESLQAPNTATNEVGEGSRGKPKNTTDGVEKKQDDVSSRLHLPLINQINQFNAKVSAEAKKATNDSGSSSRWGQGMLNATNQCPFMGIPLANVNESDSQGYYRHSRSPHWKRYGLDNNGIGNIFHRGVRCDGCGVHPITGPRFKSKVKDDYDLCSVCFAGNPNVADYIRIDRPTNAFRHHVPFKGLYDHSLRVLPPPPTLPHAMRAPGSKIPKSKLDSRFILDVNVLDGTAMAPFTPFTKIWRMRNNGSIIWPHGSQLQWIGGDRLSNSQTVDVEIPAGGLPVEKELDVAVDFTAPELPGRYISYWRMASPSGQKFGQRVWVLIQVDACMKDLGETSINLNLPPVMRSNEGYNQDPKNLIKLTDPKTTSVGPQPKDHEMNFPINDTLIIDNGVLSSTMTTTPPASPHVFSSSEVENALASLPTGPTIELDASLLEPINYPTVDYSVIVDSAPPSPVVHLGGQDVSVDQELALMKDLEDMGFKAMDVNKEVLRKNNYDLEKSIDALCDVSEWDPMLEELQEMGFEDNEANMRLLKKNNGSIKRVVMDLINGENA